jgi:hypothetical protein
MLLPQVFVLTGVSKLMLLPLVMLLTEARVVDEAIDSPSTKQQMVVKASQVLPRPCNLY